MFSWILALLITTESASSIQEKADRLRENGKAVEALDLYNQALLLFAKDEDYRSVVKVLAGKSISWQHLIEKQKSELFALFARKEAETMQKIAEEKSLNDLEFLVYFYLGKTDLLLKNYDSAEKEYEKAIHLYPREDAEKGDWMIHLGEAAYLAGNPESGKKWMDMGISKMEEHRLETDPFLFNIWTSGAYLRLAKIYTKKGDLKSANEQLQKAEAIISSDPRLVVRKEQLEALKSSKQHQD